MYNAYHDGITDGPLARCGDAMKEPPNKETWEDWSARKQKPLTKENAVDYVMELFPDLFARKKTLVEELRDEIAEEIAKPPLIRLEPLAAGLAASGRPTETGLVLQVCKNCLGGGMVTDELTRLVQQCSACEGYGEVLVEKGGNWDYKHPAGPTLKELRATYRQAGIVRREIANYKMFQEGKDE